MARARLAGDRLEDVKVIFRQDGPPSSGRHFGCRIVQTPDNNLFLTLGDHGSHPKEAQNLGNHVGKIVRVAPDGSVPNDNPFVGRKDANAGNLELRQPQCAGRGAASDDRQAVGARARPAGRRRGQHHREGQELRLAGDRLRRQLRRREDPRGDVEARHGAAGEILGAVDRAVRHGVLRRRAVPGLARQPVRRRAGEQAFWCGSRSTARR